MRRPANQSRRSNRIPAIAGVVGLAAFLVATVGRASEFSFVTDLLPRLTQAGCNAGACHGAATGQGGFRLSLLGYDPATDHARLTREFGGRRIDPSDPAASLLLQKPTGEVEHDGGRVLRSDSESYRALHAWIAAGAPYGDPDLRIARLVVDPPESWAAQIPADLPLRVVAHLSDGRTRDVSPLALYSSNDDGIATVSREGVVRLTRPGLASIMIRFGGQVAAMRVGAAFGTPPASAGDRPPRDEKRSFIDRHLAGLHQRLNLPVSPRADAVTLLRRLHLDLTGQLPSPERVQVAASSPNTAEARRASVESLLSTEAFTDLWTLHLAELFGVGGGRNGESAGRAFHAWLREQVRHDTPWDAIARAVLTVTGEVQPSNAAAFYTLASDPRDLAEHASTVFLGTRLACARCHAHPADRWTRSDYHDFAAYFARLRRDGNAVGLATSGELENPDTHRPARPRPLGEPPLSHAVRDSQGPAEASDLRVPLADWLARPDNPFLDRAFVNRVWALLMGRGLVEPVDDLRPTNPATVPALLDELAAEFARSGRRLRPLVRLIVASDAYQRSTLAVAGNEGDTRYHARALVRPLPPQVLADLIALATGVPARYPGEPPGTRAVQLAAPQTESYTLDVLGRCSRERRCATSGPGMTGGGLAQALHLIHGEPIQQQVREGLVASLVDRQAPPAEIVDSLHLRSLARLPSETERARWTSWLSEPGERRERAEDLLWALLNSREFTLNH